MTGLDDPDNRGAFEELVTLFRQRVRPLALIGAGVSVDAGYPTWSTLLQKLEDKAAPSGPKYLQKLRNLEDALWRADEYRRAIEAAQQNGYLDLLRDTFSPKSASATSRILDAITCLDFRHFITTNYDESLEAALRAGGQQVQWVDWQDPEGMRAFFQALSRDVEERYLVHLHGRHSAPQHCVLTERDYVDRYIRTDETAKRLFALFMTQHIVFLGFSLADPEITYLLRGVNAALGPEAERHYILLGLKPEDDAALTRSRLRGKFGVEPVFYPVSADGSDHSALAALLDAVCRAAANGGEYAWESVTQAAAEMEARSPVDPEDPNKGQFGGLAQRDGWTLSASVTRTRNPRWFRIDAVVKADATVDEPGSDAEFHLHPTFREDVVTEPVRRRRAAWRGWAYGAFTLGVKVGPAHATELELDLAALPDAPTRFRES